MNPLNAGFHKVTMIGGAGVRTPLLVHGIAKSQRLLGVREFALFDIEAHRLATISGISREIVKRQGSDLRITTHTDLETACAGAGIVLSSIRVGGISARACDERIAIGLGLAGQETTGPGGTAMALRTVPIALEHARIVQRVAPQAWFINFTNPAGLITQAIAQNTGLNVIGICDTPIELFHRIAWALGERFEQMAFEYAGLNHLGWVRRVTLRGEDVLERILASDEVLRKLYPADLFDPNLIRTLRLIPTEYLFFYYSSRKALENQIRAGASRGEELERLNRELFTELAAANASDGVEIYRRYLLRRNSSYMKLEAQAESAFTVEQDQYDPFETITGYHVIALDVMTALGSDTPAELVLNVPNRGSIPDLRDDDVVEVPCDIDRCGPCPHRTGPLPAAARGLVLSVKEYERTAIRAAMERSGDLAQLAMLEYPIIGDWELADGCGDPWPPAILTISDI